MSLPGLDLGNTAIVSFFLVAMLSGSVGSSRPQEFAVKLVAGTHNVNQDIPLFVSGPPDTPFEIQILQTDILLLTRSGRTSADGDWFTTLTLASSGRYIIKIFSPWGTASSELEVSKPMLMPESDDGSETIVPWGRLGSDTPTENNTRHENLSQGHQCTNLSSCAILNIPGCYRLTSDILRANPCFSILSNDTTLDCAGHMIGGIYSGSGVNITGVGNVTLVNCKIHNFMYGVTLTNIRGSVLRNISSSSCPYGVYIRSGGDNMLLGNMIDSGIRISSSNNNTVLDTCANEVHVTNESRNNTFLNCSYAGESVNSGSESIRKWHVRVNVTSGGSPVTGAKVLLKDETGNRAYSDVVGPKGLTDWFDVVGYENISGITNRHNYIIHITAFGYRSASSSFGLSRNTQINSTLRASNPIGVFWGDWAGKNATTSSDDITVAWTTNTTSNCTLMVWQGDIGRNFTNPSTGTSFSQNLTDMPRGLVGMAVSCLNSTSSGRSTLVFWNISYVITLINITDTANPRTRIVLYDPFGDGLDSLSNLSGRVAPGNYTLQFTAPTPQGPIIARINGLSIDSNLSLRSQSVESYTGHLPVGVKEVTPLFALDDADVIYDYATLAIPKGNVEVDFILHCLSWDYTSRNCTRWELGHPHDYSVVENSTHIRFNVTKFDTFGGGAGNTMPNLTEIRVYDVSGSANPKAGGVLVDNGTNVTFDLFTNNKTYRVEFWVRNDGVTWTLAAADTIYHEGLNTTWGINTNDVWYNDGSNTNYTGGTWSAGRVAWDASLGGQVNNGEWITFYYVMNLTSNISRPYSVYFLVNDTSKDSGSTDRSLLNVTKIGYMKVNITEPPTIPGKGGAPSNGGYGVGQNKLFIINATVVCLQGDCLDVNGTLRYNASSADPDKPVYTSPALPLYITSGSNPQSCGRLYKGESCSLSWTVNSTGTLGSLWKLDVLFNSSITRDNDTDDVTIEIAKILIISLSWSELTFCNDQGICPPVSEGNNAILNDQGGYNISINRNSNTVEGLYIKGTNLTAQSVSGFGSIGYGIAIGNVSWNDGMNDYNSPSTNRVAEDYGLIRSDVVSGKNVTLYFWIDLPGGQYAQEYRGDIRIKANASA
jgi:hypothetical protein